MIQEYLIQESTEKKAIENYKDERIKKRVFSANNGNCWYIQFSSERENEKNAKILSEVDCNVQKNYHVTVLEDGCSAYFNKKLYPLVSRFEYKLRKLIYLTSAINHDEKSTSNISDLESQDFGQIFSLLFIDNSFMDKVKSEVKNRNRDVFSKAEVIAKIKSFDENTVWDKLLGKDSVRTLRKRFIDVRDYRNDVMHSHHMNWDKYMSIRTLYKTINNELDEAIKDIEIVESKAPSKPKFNQTLSDALSIQEKLSALTNQFEKGIGEIIRYSDLMPKESYLNESIWGMNSLSFNIPQFNYPTISEQFGKILQTYQPNQMLLNLEEKLKGIKKIEDDISPAIKKLAELSKEYSIPKIEMPSEIIKLKNTLDEFQANDIKNKNE